MLCYVRHETNFITLGQSAYGKHTHCISSSLLSLKDSMLCDKKNNIEPWHGISNNVVCATSKASDQPAHTRSLIRSFASRLNNL